MAEAADAPGAAPEFLELPKGERIAYRRVPGRQPGVVFLGGYVSDMTGIKASQLDAFCRDRGQAFLRFDYSGHGASSGRFVDGTIGRWAEEAIAVLDALTEGPQVLVGSSMGGWIMLLVALARPERVHGLVGVAAGPDFAEDIERSLTAEQRLALERDGVYREASEEGGQSYVVTRALIEDGNQRLLLKGPIDLSCPVRLLQGMADDDVPWQTALRIAEHLVSPDVVIELVKDGDHRLWRPRDLDRLCRLVGELCG